MASTMNGTSRDRNSRATSQSDGRVEPQPTGPSSPDDETLKAARSFMRRLDGRYSVKSGILYGSRARRTHRIDSDADLAVVLKGKRANRSAATRDMAAIAFDVLMETGILIEPLPLWEREMERPQLFGNPALIRNIKRDGLPL